MPIELVLQLLSGQSVGMPSALHNGAARSAFPTHEHRHADESFVADDGYLRGGAVLHDIQQRNDGVGGEVDMSEGIDRFIEDLAERQCNSLQVRDQTLLYLLGKRGEQMVLQGRNVIGHVGHQWVPCGG